VGERVLPHGSLRGREKLKERAAAEDVQVLGIDGDVGEVAAAVVAMAFWLAPPDEPSAPASSATVGAGKRVFLTAGCVSCHTLSDAGAEGHIGPDLDAAKPSRALVINRVTNGQGAMPSFANKLSKQQIEQVADYVSSVAGT